MKLAIAVVAVSLTAAFAEEREPSPRGDGSVIAQPSRRTRVRLGGISVGAGYTHYSGPWGRYWNPYWSPYWWSAWGYGAWSPSFYDPFFHPGYFTGFARGPNMGEVKLNAELRVAELLIDGAYAGTVHERRSFWLEPGVYELEVRADGHPPFRRRVYVLSGKTLRVNIRPGKAQEAEAQRKEAKP